jgi:DNA-binding MarR family transcriptional regulator
MNIEDEIQVKFSDERFKAMINIKFTANWLNTIHNKSLEPYGLSLAQFNILRILRGAKGEVLSVTDVRDRMVERSPNTTRLMDKLIEKSLIERVRCEEDRRVVYVRIIEKGLHLLLEIDKLFNNMDDVIQHISIEEAQKLNDILNKIRK